MGVALNYQNILKVIDNINSFKEKIGEFRHRIDSDKDTKSAVENITVNYKDFLDKATIIADSLKEYYVGIINNASIDVCGSNALTVFNQYPVFPKEEPQSEVAKLNVEPETKSIKKSNK